MDTGLVFTSLVAGGKDGEMRKISSWKLAGIVMLVSVLACGPFSPPESCGDIGGTADEGLFNQYFVSMALLDTAIGSPGGISSEGEIQFTPADELEIAFESKIDVSIHACLQERKGGGKVLFNEIGSFSPGEDSFILGTYSKGSYVVRVIVDDTLVKNLPFQIE
jgi:hypothetical protein